MLIGGNSEVLNADPPAAFQETSHDLGHTCDHVVQFYDHDQKQVVESVAAFLHVGFVEGESLVVVADDKIRRGLTRRLGTLGIDTLQAVRERRLALFDAGDTLSRFMIDQQPDWERFDRSVANALREARAEPRARGLRVFGNMVDLLWKRQQFSAAIRLEQFWNHAIARTPLKLFCAYELDVFSANFAAAIDGILCTHSHVLPAGVEKAIERSLEEALGAEAAGVREAIRQDATPGWASMGAGEKMILWIRRNLADSADAILGRARQYHLLPA